jgi:hypothetical protein
MNQLYGYAIIVLDILEIGIGLFIAPDVIMIFALIAIIN